LAVLIPTPANNRSVGFEGKAVTGTAMDLRRASKRWRNIDLALIVQTPRGHCSIGSQGKAVPRACTNL
jgi:hypothetical protein